jgi:hypothetical protein
MSLDLLTNVPVASIVAVLTAGLTLFLGGVGNALIRPRRPGVRAAVSGLGGAIALTVLCPPFPEAAGQAVIAALVAGLVTFMAGSDRVAAVVTAATGILGHARVRGAGLGVMGLVLVAAGAGQIGTAVGVAELDGADFMGELMAMPPVEPEHAVTTTTDYGSPIRLMKAISPRAAEDLKPVEQRILTAMRRNGRLIRHRPADDLSNCFGWVFADGRYWLDGDQVERILAENGYRVAPRPSAGDVAVYRDEDGEIGHAAVVRAVCDDGSVLVEGKWGWMGVFLHRADDSCYGQGCTYYRSARSGHALAGLVPSTAPDYDFQDIADLAD